MNECIITRENISSNDAVDVVCVAEALANICESKADAVRFLENVITQLDPTRAPKKRPLTYEANSEDGESHLKVARPGANDSGPDGDVINDIYDEGDSAIITLCVLIPNDIQLCSSIIGKQGCNISEIKRRTQAKTQIERVQDIPFGCTERHVFFMGSLRSVCEAFQLMWARLVDKTDSLPPAVLDGLRMVVPSDLCAPLIGRGGVVIKKIQTDSGAHTHVQSEEEMRQTGHFFGRVINITGSLRQRCHAMYLLLKQLLTLKDFPEPWRGNVPLPVHGMPMHPHQHYQQQAGGARYPQVVGRPNTGMVPGGFPGGGQMQMPGGMQQHWTNSPAGMPQATYGTPRQPVAQGFGSVQYNQHQQTTPSFSAVPSHLPQPYGKQQAFGNAAAPGMGSAAPAGPRAGRFGS